MAIAREKGRLRGKQPKLSDKQQKELYRMQGTGQDSISDLAEFFSFTANSLSKAFPGEKKLIIRIINR